MLSSSSDDFLQAHSSLLLASYYQQTGNQLLSGESEPETSAQRLFDSSFAVVSHDTQNTPVFNYGNAAALTLFEMQWQEFVSLPSYKSAEVVSQAERDQLLAEVNIEGFIDNYQGVRISAKGRRFKITKALVWNVVDGDNNYKGQAAILHDWTFL